MALHIRSLPYAYLYRLVHRPATAITASWHARSALATRCRTSLESPQCTLTRHAHTTPAPRPHHHNRTSSSRKIFQDRVRLSLTAGHGGSGCTSYEKLRTGKQIPNGGNGGAGGSIYIHTVDNMQTYEFSSYHVNAPSGSNGSSDNCTGRNGGDVVIRVPSGTVVHSIDGKDADTNKLLTTELTDLHTTGMKYIACRGGAGGYGNKSFKRDYRRQSEYSSVGQPGAAIDLLLELKSIADIGLVGYPNAGKSSLLGAVSAAKPTVAAYPFTTLQPFIGMVDVGDVEMNLFSVADIPGLIDGAHVNRGLGHEFLRHIERTKVLMYVIDVSGSERDPVDDYATLRNELKLYQYDLINRPSLIFCNKMDAGEHCQHNVERIQQYTNMSVPIVCGSALTGDNMKELIDTCFSTLQQAERQQLKLQAEQAAKRAATEAELQHKRMTFKQKSLRSQTANM